MVPLRVVFSSILSASSPKLSVLTDPCSAATFSNVDCGCTSSVTVLLSVGESEFVSSDLSTLGVLLVAAGITAGTSSLGLNGKSIVPEGLLTLFPSLVLSAARQATGYIVARRTARNLFIKIKNQTGCQHSSKILYAKWQFVYKARLINRNY